MSNITRMTSNPDIFLEIVSPIAKEVCAKYEIFASVALAQAIQETGWGKQVIGLYNIFGRKASKDQIAAGFPVLNVPTYEVVDGVEVEINDYFMDYPSIEVAFVDYCELLTTDPQYSEVMENRHNLIDYVHTLAGVYCTDPEYARNILVIIEANDLRELDAI